MAAVTVGASSPAPMELTSALMVLIAVAAAIAVELVLSLAVVIMAVHRPVRELVALWLVKRPEVGLQES